MSDVLYVSKAVEPPWNDSSKNLVRDVAWGLTRYRPILMVGDEAAAVPSGGRAEPIYHKVAGAFAPGLSTQLRVMRRLVFGSRVPLWHFFFAPNRKSSMAARYAAMLRGTPTVQTVCSAPHEDADIRSLLFADRTVVLSEHTRRRFVSAGVPAEQLAVIPPGIEPLNPLGAEAKRIVRESFGIPTDHSIVLYPGDLEFGGGAQVVTRLVADLPAATSLVMACRAKTALAVQAEQELKAGLRERGLEDRVFWIGETPKIHDLVSAADIVVLPTESLFAKMDYPLVLLEAMSAGVPVVVSEGTAAAELAQYGAVVCPCESTALLDALSGLIDDPSERTHRGLKGAEAVRDVFGRAALASAYERLYDDILR